MTETAPRVLIVDDHLMMRQFTGNALRGSCNITDIETAHDGAEAIRLLENAHGNGRPFDIVLLDWNMPNVSGLEVLSYFRAKPEFDRTAFVMLTSETEQREIARAIRAGVTSYICKPVSADELAKKLNDLRHWLDHPRCQPR
jgi:two-component system chemotaxis response regulator CheY